eukprot:TRINITY_DN9899_c0_g1_i1.p1 TRINITY_DN9899_c0_g1~~TRINITY_DN9899_c0_g1_i1.p1  ORF type:complete len:743 (-),score=107.09 TRINITY_DN9899_c0_g1_i1:25-2223(-)
MCPSRSRCLAICLFGLSAGLVYTRHVEATSEDLTGDDECDGNAECSIALLQRQGQRRSELVTSSFVPPCTLPTPCPAAWTSGYHCRSNNGCAHHAPFPDCPDQCIIGTSSTTPRLQSTPKADCHTAVQGESCWEEVQWASSKGIELHPDWYSGLSASSSSAAFQCFVHLQSPGKCPQPCGVDCRSGASPESSCHTTLREEACWDEVHWVSDRGVHEHPDWYPGLSASSSLAAVQCFVHLKSPGKCPKPCGMDCQNDKPAENNCHTTLQGEACWEEVQWASGVGIREHPEWYPGLGASSSLARVQCFLHNQFPDKCPKPCGLSCTASNVSSEPTAKASGGMQTCTETPCPATWQAGYYCRTSNGCRHTSPFEDCKDQCAIRNSPALAEECHTALQGESCWNEVHWASSAGITEHPDWYPSLSAGSSFSDFQCVVHRMLPDKCPKPCGQDCKAAVIADQKCHSVTRGEKCWDQVEWAATEGIQQHPDWYPGLRASSSRAEFQCMINAMMPSGCPEPCGIKTCLCVFDIDRTLTGRQGQGGTTCTDSACTWRDGAACPANVNMPDTIDWAYGGGGLTLSELSASGLKKTFCGKCHFGIVSHGTANGVGSELRPLLLNRSLQDLDNALPTSSASWSDEIPESPLVVASPDGKKQEAVDIILRWYRRKGACIPRSNVHFFDDRPDNVAAFQGTGMNARQISCGSRDLTLDKSGAVGLCGARLSEIVPDRGVRLCAKA